MRRVVYRFFLCVLLALSPGNAALGVSSGGLLADAPLPALQGNATLPVSPRAADGSLPFPPTAGNGSVPSLPGANVLLRPHLQFSPLVWVQLHQGLSMGKSFLSPAISRRDDSGFTIVRIDPALYTFSLHMASQDAPARSLGLWAEKYGLYAGINASMYLPDNITSTGYMRSGRHTNNARVGSRLGAFFVANPYDPSLPQVDILEGQKPETKALLSKYDMVVQNYRLISSQGGILWAEGGAMHSIAAVAREKSGTILFILCQDPLTAHEFARALQEFSLELGTVMYVEGGAQAGVFVKNTRAGALNTAQNATQARNAPAHTPLEASVPANGAPPAQEEEQGSAYTVLKGRQSLLFFKGNEGAPLPNIIGVRPREDGSLGEALPPQTPPPRD